MTTGIQIVDLVAYVLSWGFRTRDMGEPAREERSDLVQMVSQLRYKTVREVEDQAEFTIWSIAVIKDLRAEGSLDVVD